MRWWALFDARQRPPLGEVTRALLVGYFFNNILPARAGEAASVITLHGRTRTPRAETIGTVVAERVFDLLALLVILFAAYPWLPQISWLRAAAIFAIVVVVGVAALVFALVRYDERAIHWLLSPLRRVRRDGFAERVEHAAINGTRGLVAIRDPRVALVWMLLTVAVVGRAEPLLLDPHAGVLARRAVRRRPARHGRRSTWASCCRPRRRRSASSRRRR